MGWPLGCRVGVCHGLSREEYHQISPMGAERRAMRNDQQLYLVHQWVCLGVYS